MNKFGRSLPTTSRQKGVRVLQAPNLIALTKNGDYNLRDHRLCNVKSPEEDADAVNKKFVDSLASSLLAKIDKTSSDCTKLVENAVKEIENQINDSVDNYYMQYVDSKDNQLRDDIKSLVSKFSDANKNYIDSNANQLRTDLKTLNAEFLALSKSFDTIHNTREADYMRLEERFKAIDAQIQTAVNQTTENLKSEFDQLEAMLKSTISSMVQNHTTSFVVELATIKKELSQLIEKVGSLETKKV